MLLRAFGPPDAAGPTAPPPAPSPSPTAAFERAERLALSVRIACRSAGPATHGPSLEDELGAEVAARFRSARRAAAARDAQIEALAAAVARVAADLRVPVALLKYGALRAVGALSAAGRLASDLDLLVRPEDAPPLRDALLARGWRATGLPAWEHHLPALRHPGLGELELHDRLPGLSPPGTQGATAAGVGYDHLAERSALGQCSWPAPLRAPSRPVLLAHALVHGLVQHGWAPRSYPPWRGVSDWIDLGLGGADGAALLAAASPWIGGVLSAEEAEAARRLCVLLAEGRPDALAGEGSATDRDPDGERAAALGRHLLAGPLDPTYRRALRLGRLVPAPGAGHRREGAGSARAGPAGQSGQIGQVGQSGSPRALGASLRLLGRALAPPRAELAALYGPWRSRWGLAWRRLVRPADLALRTVTAAASRLRGRWRGPVRL